MPLKSRRVWALAMNASRARIVRNIAGDPSDQSSELVIRSGAEHLREVMSDRPGRSFASSGTGRRSAMEYGSDPLAEDERRFVRQVVDMLDTHRRAGDFDTLAIFAEPSVLGRLRDEMPERLRAVTTCEVPKNYLQVPANDLTGLLAKEIAEAGNMRNVQ